jgi:dUTP pyrophosphatase
MIVKIKKLHPNAVIPAKASDLAAGWDVTCTEIEKGLNGLITCKTGFALQPPPNYRVVLIPRSSITKTMYVMQNSPGCGDPDYLGEYIYKFRALPKEGLPFGSLSYEGFPFKAGERIGQLFLQEIIPIEFEEVIELDATNRGTGGFGSTGK